MSSFSLLLRPLLPAGPVALEPRKSAHVQLRTTHCSSSTFLFNRTTMLQTDTSPRLASPLRALSGRHVGTRFHSFFTPSPKSSFCFRTTRRITTTALFPSRLLPSSPSSCFPVSFRAACTGSQQRAGVRVVRRERSITCHRHLAGGTQ